MSIFKFSMTFTSAKSEEKSSQLPSDVSDLTGRTGPGQGPAGKVGFSSRPAAVVTAALPLGHRHSGRQGHRLSVTGLVCHRSGRDRDTDCLSQVWS